MNEITHFYDAYIQISSQRLHTMVMEAIQIERAKILADKKGLKPGRVKGTEKVQITKGLNPRVEVITWEAFATILKKRGLALYESGGFLKIMRV